MFPELFPFFGGTCIDSRLKMPLELIGENGFCKLEFTPDVLNALASANIGSLHDLLLLPKAEASRCFAENTRLDIEDAVTNWLYAARRALEIDVQHCMERYLAADVDGLIDEPWHEFPFFNGESRKDEDGIRERFPCTSISVHSLGLTMAVLSGLLNYGVRTMAQLLASPEGKLTSIPYFGQNKLNKLKVIANACMSKWVNGGDEEGVADKHELPNFALLGGTLTQMPEELKEFACSEFPVYALPLSTMVKNRLREGGVYVVGSLLTLSPQELAGNCKLSGNSTGMVIKAVRDLLFTDMGDFEAEHAAPDWSADERIIFRDALQLPTAVSDKDIDVPVSRLNLSKRATTVVNRLRIKTVAALLDAKVGKVANARGAGAITIEELRRKLEDYFNPTFISMRVSGLSELLMNYFSESMTETEAIVYNARCAEEKYTLDQISEKFNLGVTRERVRQYVKSAEAKLGKSSYRLTPLWNMIETLIQEAGYAVPVRNLAKKLAEDCSWSAVPTAREIKSLLRIAARWRLEGDIIADCSLCCFECDSLRKALAGLAMDSLLDHALESAAVSLREEVCADCAALARWNVSWLTVFFKRHEPWKGLHLHNGRLLGEDVWERRVAVQYASKRRLVEIILNNSPGALSLTEILVRYRETRPNEDASIIAIDSYCSRP